MGIERHLVWDFGEFDRHIEALARGLLELGVKKGDRVGVVMGNSSAYASLQWACASIGAILVTLNPAYRLPELVNTLNIAGVSHLFIVPSIRSSAYIRMLVSAFPGLAQSQPGSIQEPALPTLRHLIVVDNAFDVNLKAFHEEIGRAKCAVDFREVLVWREDGAPARTAEEVRKGLEKDDVVNLQFTSGTTGLPKAVSLTHHNLLNNALAIGRRMRLIPSDVIWNLAAWTHGACIVYPSQIFDASATVDAVVEEQCTALHGVPTHFLRILNEVKHRREAGDRVDTSALRTGIISGAPVPIDYMKQLIANLNLSELTVAYGMTETSPVSFQTTPDDPIIKRVETVGRVQPHVRAKLVDGEGNTVPVGTPGEIMIAGYLLQKGYWMDETHTASAMQRDEDGTLWMRSGDEGVMDEHGYLKVLSRIKDIIIRGGENLFPVQIENILLAHPAVSEAAAVAVPDDHLGEVVGAWIVREPGTKLSKEEVRALVAQGMNPQNAPAWVWFVGEDGVSAEMPRTASGKVQKHVLREWAQDLARKDVGRVGAKA